MNKPKFPFSITAFFFICLLSFSNSFAQTEAKQQAEAVYEIVLQTLVASNNTSVKTDVSPSLSNVLKKLKTTYPFTNYRLTSTYLQRVANTGNIEFKSVTNEANQNQENYAPIFSEWSLVGLRNLPNARGQNSIQFQIFRFGQRVPIRTASYKDESGKLSSVVNYEQIGLTLNKFGLSENVPTVIGSLASANGEVMFLVLTVKPINE